MGAEVKGFALAPTTTPALLPTNMRNFIGGSITMFN